MIPWPSPPTSFERWAAELHLALPTLDINPISPKEKEWKAWGNQVAQSAICQTAQVPRTDSFKTWQEWVVGMIKAFGPQQ